MLIPRAARAGAQAGTTMMEVLVSIVIVVLGLLGLAGLQSQAALAEMEAFQRAQAVILLQDIVDRINANRKNSMSYVTAGDIGTDLGEQDCTSATNVAERDICEWNNALVGASESSGGLKVGAMIGARGCVVNVQPAMPREFLVSVVWQGLRPTAENLASDCGAGEFGTDERQRRVLTSRVVIGCLQNDPASGTCVTP